MSGRRRRSAETGRAPARPYHRGVPIWATLVLVVGFAAGGALGWALGVRTRRGQLGSSVELGADLRAEPGVDPGRAPDTARDHRRRPSPPLAGLVVEALDHGVVVIDREERA